MNDDYLTEAQAAQELMVTRENLRRMIWSGKIAGEPIDDAKTAYRVSARSIQRLIDEGGYVPGASQPTD